MTLQYTARTVIRILGIVEAERLIIARRRAAVPNEMREEAGRNILGGGESGVANYL